MFALLAQVDSLMERINLDRVRSYLLDQGPDLAGNLIAAIAIFLIGRWAAKVASELLTKVCQRADFDETLAKFLSRILHTLILLFVVMAALERLGVNTTSFAAVVAAAGLAVGLALQGSLSNFAAGVMIILFRPFKVGDFVEAGGATGVVEEIHIFHTMMRTGDNIQLVVPNSAVTSGNISNYSAKETRRIDLVVGCGYDDDLKTVKQFLLELVDSDPRILRDPEPVVAVHELADNSVNFVVRPWVATADYWQVRWDLTEAVKTGFDEHGFSIPFPQRDIHIHQVAADVAKPKPERPITLALGTAAGTQLTQEAVGPGHAISASSTIDVYARPTQNSANVRPRRAG